MGAHGGATFAPRQHCANGCGISGKAKRIRREMDMQPSRPHSCLRHIFFYKELVYINIQVQSRITQLVAGTCMGRCLIIVLPKKRREGAIDAKAFVEASCLQSQLRHCELVVVHIFFYFRFLREEHGIFCGP